MMESGTKIKVGSIEVDNMLQELEKMISDLNWNNPIDVQEKAIENLLMVDEKQVIFLIQPLDKSHWQNAAVVIKKWVILKTD